MVGTFVLRVRGQSMLTASTQNAFNSQSARREGSDATVRCHKKRTFAGTPAEACSQVVVFNHRHYYHSDIMHV